MFNRTTDDSRIEALTAEIRTLSKRVADLKGERDSVNDELGLSKRLVALEKEKTEKEIELDRVKEQHEREKRDIDHKIGPTFTATDAEVADWFAKPWWWRIAHRKEAPWNR